MAESTPLTPFPHPTAPECIALDEDVHGFKSQGQGDLSKKTAFPDPDTHFQEYPKHVIIDGKTYTVAGEGEEPVLIAEASLPEPESAPKPAEPVDALGDPLTSGEAASDTGGTQLNAAEQAAENQSQE